MLYDAGQDALNMMEYSPDYAACYFCLLSTHRRSSSQSQTLRQVIYLRLTAGRLPKREDEKINKP